MKTSLGILLAALLVMAGAAATAGERTVKLSVDKMTCAACPYIVKKSLTRVDGVRDAKVSLASKTAVVTFDDDRTTVEQLTKATGDAGFPSREIEQGG